MSWQGTRLAQALQLQGRACQQGPHDIALLSHGADDRPLSSQTGIALLGQAARKQCNPLAPHSNQHAVCEKLHKV